MKVKDLGRVVPLFRGVYNPEIEDGYEVLDMVYADGATWVSLIDNPTDTPSDESNQWQIVCRAMINDEQIQEIEAAVLEIVAQQGYVMDPDYVHTSNDFTDELKAKVEAYEPPTGNPFGVTMNNGSMSLYLIPGQTYSPDNVVWTPVVNQTVITLEAGDTLYLHCTKTMPIMYGWKVLENNNAEYTISGDLRSLHYVKYDSIDTLRSREFMDTFSGCSGLDIDVNFVLPATVMSRECYSGLFRNCTSLTAAPALPAEILAQNCYNGMFDGCTLLTTAPALPATTLAQQCYSAMFQYCESLTTAPTLPATTLADSCYSYMFRGCTGLTTAPTTLPATTLDWGCYMSMFENCTSLTNAPTLPATAPAQNAYSYMFGGCNSLTYVKCLLGTLGDGSVCGSFLPQAETTGTFVKNSANNEWESWSDPGIPQNWTIESEVVPVSNNWFTVTISEGPVSFRARFDENGQGGDYSTDGGQTWNHKNEYEEQYFELNAGDTVMFHATGNYWARFSIWDGQGDGHIAFSGDLRSVSNEKYAGIDTYNTSKHSSAFYGLQQLYDISQLTLGYTKCIGNASFSQMFRECRNLQNTPIWTITLVEGTNQEVFDSMFNECTSLTSTVDLHNMTVGVVNNTNVFQNMYYNCTGLTSISNAFPTPASYKNVSFNGMFRECHNLQRVEDGLLDIPEMLDIIAMGGIFENCYMLQYIKIYSWFPLYENWLQDAGLDTSPTIYLPADAQPYESYQNRSGSGIPENWSIEYYS